MLNYRNQAWFSDHNRNTAQYWRECPIKYNKNWLLDLTATSGAKSTPAQEVRYLLHVTRISSWAKTGTRSYLKRAVCYSFVCASIPSCTICSPSERAFLIWWYICFVYILHLMRQELSICKSNLFLSPSSSTEKTRTMWTIRIVTDNREGINTHE